MEFDWDAANESHIALHGISRLQVEAALADPFGDILDSEIASNEARYRHLRSAPGGRLLIVIFTMRGHAVRPVTAFDATRSLARKYREGPAKWRIADRSGSMTEKIVVPDFADESEEADWWFQHREQHDEIMAKAMEQGSTKKMTEFLAEHGQQPARILVPVDFNDMMLAQEQARAKGINPEVYVRNLLHQAIASNEIA